MRLTDMLLWLAVICAVLPREATAQSLPFGLSLPPSLNFATSPSPVGSGARANGQALAFIGVADDATAASHNPGGLPQLLEPEVSIVGSYLIRLENQDITQPDTVVEDQTLDAFNLNYFSAVYPFEFLKRLWVVSLNYQRLFNLQGDSAVASFLNPTICNCDALQRARSEQEGGLFAISPAVAVGVTPNLGIGIAFNIWPNLLDNGWTQDVMVQAEGRVSFGNRTVPFRSEGRIHEDYAFEGFNMTMGFLWEINSLISLGGVFRSPFTAKVTRTHTSEITVTLQTPQGAESKSSSDKFTETLDMDMPMAYGLGLAVHVTDRLRLSLDVSRIHWSDFRLQASSQDTILVENGAPTGKGGAVLRGEADDTTSVRVGGQYLWRRLALRTGFFYDPEPGQNGTDDFFGASLGGGIVTAGLRVDMAYIFRTGTIESEATDTTVYHHELFASVIYSFERD